MASNGEPLQEAPQPAPSTDSKSPIADRVKQLRAQAQPTPILERYVALKGFRAAQAAPGQAPPPGPNELVNETLRLPPGRIQAAQAAVNPKVPIEDVAFQMLKFARPGGIGRMPTREELLAAPLTRETVQQLDKVAVLSRQQSKARYGEGADPVVYSKALMKFATEKEKEVAEDRKAIRDKVQKGYWPVDMLGEPPEWATRKETDAPTPQPLPPIEELAGQGVGALESALRAERPPPAAEWMRAKEEGEVKAEALKRAQDSAIPGVHTPPLTDKDVAALTFELVQARAAGREAEFDKAHPIVSTMLREVGAFAPMIGAGAVIGPTLRGLGIASAGLRGALEMAALDSGDQIARMLSGAQEHYDPIRALTSVGTFAGAAAVSQRAAEWALTRRIRPLVKAAGPEAVDKAIAAIPTATREQVARMSGQQQELIRRIEAARQVANLIGAGSNIVTFNAALAAQGMLEDAHKADLGGELGKTGARAVVDLLLSLAAAKAFPAHVRREKAAEIADRIADVEAETMRRMAAEGPPAAAGRIERDTPPVVEPEPGAFVEGPMLGGWRVPREEGPRTNPSPRGAYEAARNALVRDFRVAPDEQFQQTLADPIVVGKYADSFGLSGTDRIRLRRAAEDMVTAQEGTRARPLQALRGAELMNPEAKVPSEPRPREGPLAKLAAVERTARDKPLSSFSEAERPAAKLSQGDPIKIAGSDVPHTIRTMSLAEGMAVATGDRMLANHIGSAMEVFDRLTRNGSATATPDELAVFAAAASKLQIAAEPRKDIEPQSNPIPEYVEAARVVELALESALLGRNTRLNLAGRTMTATGKADAASMRAASALEIGGEAHVTTASGEIVSLSPTGKRQLARDLRDGRIKAEARAQLGGEGAASAVSIRLKLSDGSDVDVAPVNLIEGGPTGQNREWRLLHEAYKKIEKQGGAAFFGSSKEEIAFSRAVEHQLAENAHAIFAKEAEGSIRDLLSYLPADVGRSVRSLILHGLGYAEEAEAARALALGQVEAARFRGELAEAKAGLDKFLAPYKNKDELLGVLVELQQRKGKSDKARLWKPEILEQGKEALRPVLEVADRIGKRLYDLERLPWAVHKPKKGRKLIVMKKDRAEYEAHPPNPEKWGPLVGGVKFYEQEGYLTHAMANEVLREAQATDGRPWMVSRLGAITKNLKSLVGSAFKSRKYQGEQAWERGIRANVPKTLDTLMKEIGGIVEARAQDHLADVGLFVKEKPEPGNMADVQIAKLKIEQSIKVTQDLLHSRMGIAAQAHKAGDRPRLVKALAEAGVARRVLEEHYRQLYAADQITSGWKQVTGFEWGKRDGWFMRNDALHTLKERSAQLSSWWKALFAFTGMQRILRNRYSLLRMPSQNWFSNVEANLEILGVSPFNSLFHDSHKRMWKYLRDGVLEEPILRELVSRGLVRTSAGQAEAFMSGSAERALKMADRAAQDGRHGDVVGHWFEAMFHSVAGLPEKVPGVGSAFTWMAHVTNWSDAAPMYHAVRCMVEGIGTPFGRKLSIDEAVTRAGRLYDFSRMNPIANRMMRLGFFLVGYSSKVGEALFGPPVKPRYLGMPIPGGEALAWMAHDPTTKAGKAAYAAYKGLGIAGAALSSLTPFWLLGYAMRNMFVPQLSSEEVDRAREEYLRSEGKGTIARAFSSPFLVPWGMSPDNRVKFFDLRPISWIGAAIDFGSGWIGTARKSMLTSIAEKTTWGGLWHVASDRPTDPEEDTISGIRHSAPYWLTRMVTPGVLFNAIDSALRQWKDAGELNLVPWPAEVLQFLTSIRSVRGDISEARQRYYELEDEGRYEWTKPELIPKNPTDVEAIITQKLQGVNFQSSPAYERWKELQAKKKLKKLER